MLRLEALINVNVSVTQCTVVFSSRIVVHFFSLPKRCDSMESSTYDDEEKDTKPILNPEIPYQEKTADPPVRRSTRPKRQIASYKVPGAPPIRHGTKRYPYQTSGHWTMRQKDHIRELEDDLAASQEMVTSLTAANTALKGIIDQYMMKQARSSLSSDGSSRSPSQERREVPLTTGYYGASAASGDINPGDEPGVHMENVRSPDNVDVVNDSTRSTAVYAQQEPSRNPTVSTVPKPFGTVRKILDEAAANSQLRHQPLYRPFVQNTTSVSHAPPNITWMSSIDRLHCQAIIKVLLRDPNSEGFRSFTRMISCGPMAQRPNDLSIIDEQMDGGFINTVRDFILVLNDFFINIGTLSFAPAAMACPAQRLCRICLTMLHSSFPLITKLLNVKVAEEIRSEPRLAPMPIIRGWIQQLGAPFTFASPVAYNTTSGAAGPSTSW